MTRSSLFDTWQPTARTHLLHACVAVFLVAVDVLSSLSSPAPPTPVRVGLTIINAACLPLTSRFPLVGAVASLPMTALALTIPDGIGLAGTSVSWATLTLLVSRGYQPALCWFLASVNLLGEIMLNDTLYQTLIGPVATGLPCLTLGFTLRHQRRRDDRAAHLRNERRNHYQQVLVSELHDTVVRNLSHAVMQAEQVRLNHPEDQILAYSLDSVTSPVRTAVGQLRHLLKAMSATSDDEPLPFISSSAPRTLADTLDHAEQILGERGTSLKATGLETLDSDVIGPGAYQQITRVLNELIDNAVKYSAPNGIVTLLLETDEDNLTCVCTNSQSSAHQTPQRHRNAGRAPHAEQALSSGLGLDAARRRVESLGGTLETSQSPQHWVTTFTIPLRPTM